MKKRKATIAFINSIPADTFGGGEKWFLNSAQELQKRGHRIVLVARPGSIIVEKFRQMDCHIIEITFGSDFNPLNIFRFVRLFRKLAVSHLVLNFNKDVSIAGIAGRLSGVEKILFRNGFPIIKQKLKHHILMPFYDTIISNSYALVEYYNTFGWHLEKKIKVIYNGIELPLETTPGNMRKKDGHVRILGVGRLTKTKRFDLFLNVAARINQKRPVVAIIAGEGAEKDALAMQAKRSGLQVNFLGHVGTLHKLFPQVDILLHTSRMEGLPNVVMEAMAYGVPVVATNSGGTNELLKDGFNGFLCTVNDENEIFEKLVRLIEDDVLKKYFIGNARDTINKHFSLVNSIDKLEQALFE